MPPPVTYKGTFPADHSELSAGQLHAPFHYVQASDPGAVGAGKWWFNTSTNILKVRNDTDTGWNAVTVDDNYVNTTGDGMAGALQINVDANPAFMIQQADGDNVLFVRSSTTPPVLTLSNGALFNIFSDNAFGTEKFAVDGTNGNISSKGTLRLDVNSDDAILVRDVSGSDTTFRVTSQESSKKIQGFNGADLELRSDSGATLVFSVKGANGRIITGGSTPSIAAGGSAGSGSSQAISGNNQSGQITFTPGSGQGAGTILTVTFGGSVDRGGTSYGVWLNMRDADALTDMTKVRTTPSSGTQWTIVANAVLNTNEHVWDYLIVER
jgi:hypothetical protein